MLRSRESNTYSVRDFEEAYLVEGVRTNQGENNYLIFFSLVVVDIGYFDKPHAFFINLIFMDQLFDLKKLARV
jgi:hypothetical protein